MSPSLVLLVARLYCSKPYCYIMFALFYSFLYIINDVKKGIHVLVKPQRSSLRIHLCGSERSERAIFGVFNSFTVKKVNFFTINVKFKVILSSKSGGGGGYLYRPSPPPKKVGGDYASGRNRLGSCTRNNINYDITMISRHLIF